MTKNYQNQKTSVINRWLRSAILVIAAFAFAFNAQGQVGTPSFYNTVPTTSTNAFPLASATSNKVQWIYGPGVFSSNGTGTGTFVGAGNNITKVYIRIQTVNATNVYSPNFEISMTQSGTSNVFAAATGTIPFLTGLTSVYQSSAFQFTGIVTGSWYGITLTTPFAYDPSLALIIEVKSNLATSGGNSVNSISTTGLMQRIYAAYASPTGTTNTGSTPMGFDVVPNAVCTSPPTPGTATATPSSGMCIGANIALNLSGNTLGSGQTYQWQTSVLIGGPYTNLGSSQASSSLNTPATSTLYYRCEVTCSANSQLSTPVLVTPNPAFPGGVYTINAAGPAVLPNFQSFTAFKNAIACGISGAVVANVVGGSGPYNEQVEFPAIGGVSAINTITINGNSNTLTYAASLSTAPGTLILNGTDYMTVNNLIVEGTGATYALVCHLWNQADNNAFNNCTFNAPANGTSTTQVPFSISGSATTGTTAGVSGSNNVITGCTMFSGYYNTAIVGNSSGNSTGNQVINCNIRDQYLYATYCLYQTGLVLRGNTLERPTRTTLSTYYGLYISTACTNVLVEKNRIRNPFATAPTTTGTLYGIYCTVDASIGNENKFYNNVISDINFEGTIYAMYMSGSDYWKAYHNTISLDQTSATTASTCYGIYATGTLAYDARNNIISISRGGTATKYCVYYSNPAAATSNNNDLYMNAAAGTNNIGYNGTAYTTLALWQAGSGKDANSVSVNPLYLSPGTYDYTPANGLVNDIGAPLGVTDDINSAARSLTTPDPGAYEFSLGGLDAGISWVSPTSPATAGLYTITVNINNTQAQTITSLDLSYNDGSGPVNESFTGLNIPSGSNQNISFAVQYNLVSNVTITANIINVNGGADAVAGNNTTNYSLCISLNGTYTINSAVVTGGTNFQTFNAAVAALACGISNPVVFNVVAASGPYNEQVSIPAISGASAVNTVTFNGNGNTLTFAATSAGAPHTLVLNGADYINVNNLIIAGTGATYALVCHLWNQADNNAFTNCTFNAPANGTSTTMVPFSISGSASVATTSGVSGNNNVITGCTIFSGYYNTCFVGNSAGANTGNQLINCNIRDQYLYGSYNLYQNGMVIRGNILERTTRTTLSTYYGIYLSSGCTNMLVEKNKIRKTWDTAPASTGTQYSIYCTIDASVGNENKFYNNLISDINFAGTIYGMYMSGSDYWQAYHNTISLDQTASTATAATYGIYCTGTLAMDVRNNNISIKRGGTGTKYGVYYSTPAAATSNNNNIYVNSAGGGNNVGYNGTAYATLALWQAGSGKDANSVSADPLYISPATGNYKPASSTLDNVGTGLGITDDILNLSRSAVDPDPGAYEFSVSPKDAGAITLITPGTGGCYTNAEAITIEIKNYGSTMLDFGVDPVTVTCNVTGAATATLTGSPTGTLAVGATMNVAMSTTLDMTTNGTYTFNAFTTMTLDGNLDNDPMLPEVRTVAPVAGVVSSSQTTICVSGLPTLTVAGVSGGSIQWQESSTSASGPWTNVGAGANTYAPATFTQTMYYQALTVCNTNNAASNTVTVTLTNPQITGTTPGTRCGFGSVTVGATSTGQGTINWYDSPTGGISLGTGGSYMTNINSTTTFYAEENVGGGGGSSSAIQVSEVDLGTNDQLEIQNVSPDPVNVTGWKVAISNSYTDITSVNANIQTLSGTMNPGAIMNWTDLAAGPNYWGSNMFWNPGAFPSFAGWAIIVDNNNVIKDFAVWNWPSANIQGASLVIGGNTFTIGTQWSGNGIDATTVLATQSLSRQGSTDNNTLSDFSIINLSIGTTNPGMTIPFTGFGCASTRVAVAATVTPAPALSVIAVDPAICPLSSTSVSVSSINDPDYTYSWTSTPAGFTATGAGPHTVSPTVTTWYKVTAIDNTAGPNAGCAIIDSVQVITGATLAAGTVAASQTSLCVSGVPTLTVTGSDGGAIQWQKSTVSASGPWTNVGTGATVYNAGTLTQTTYFQVTVTCQSTSVTSNVETVVVNTPLITGSTGATRCGVGNVTLQATGSAGSTLNWYSASTGGSSLGSGTSFITSVTGSTNFYVGATSGGGGGTATATMPSQLSTFAGNVRGYWFTAPSSFTMTGVRVPLAGTGQSIAVVRFTGNIPPPTFSATTNAFTTLFLTQNNASTGVIPCNVSISAGDVIGILGQVGAGAAALTSYGPGTNPTNVTIAGSSVPLTRMLMQFPLSTTAPQLISQEITATSSIGRVEFEYTTGCESARTAVPVTVIPAPPVTVSVTNTNMCIGQTATLSATSTNPGYSYTWNPGALSGASVVVTPGSNTVYTLSAIDNSSGPYDQCAATGTASVAVVSQLPPDPIANSNAVNGSICEGTSLSLSSDNIASGQLTNTYLWTGPSLYSSPQQNPSVTTSASPATHTGTYTVVVTNQYLCTASTGVTIAVNPNPVLSVVSTNGVSCVGLCDGDVTIGATVGLAPYLFIDANFNFSANGVFTDNQCEATGQQIDVVDDNGCTANILYNIGHISSVPPSINVPNPPITGLPVSACLGTTASLSTPAVPLATQYIWDGPSGTTFSSINPYTSITPTASITFGSPNGSGYYIGVQAANGCGASLRRTQWVRGTTSVPAAITGSTIACPNSNNAPYSTGAVVGATQYLWTITGDATVTGTGTNVTVNFGPTFTTGTLCVSAQTSCFTSAAKCITITRSAPIVPAISGTFSACSGQTLTYCVAPQAGIASYAWTLPAGATGSSSTNCISVTFGAGFSGGDITVVSSTICGDVSAPRSTTINLGSPSRPASITGPVSGLCGQTIVYQCPSQVGATFSWTNAVGTINSGQGSNAISTTFGTFTAASTVCVTANNSCGSSAARCITVNGRPNPPGAITAIPSSWCANTAGIEFNVDVSNLTGSYTLSWIYPSPAIATYVLGGGNSTSLILNWISGSGPVHVTASNACGNQSRSSTQSNSCREGEEVFASENTSLQVYPNPTTGNINIEFSSITKGNASVSVMDIAGRTITSQNINVTEGLNQTQLDLSKVAKGIYMLNVNSNEATTKVKIVVE